MIPDVMEAVSDKQSWEVRQAAVQTLVHLSADPKLGPPLLVLPSFKKLAAVYAKELELGFEEMSRITLSDGKLVLDPRPDGDAELPGAGGSF